MTRLSSPTRKARLADGSRVRIKTPEPLSERGNILAHYDATEEPSTGSVSEIEDRASTHTLSGSAEIVAEGVNGQQSYRFDGISDSMVNDSLNVSESFVIGMVYETTDTQTDSYFFDCSPNNVSDAEEEFRLWDSPDGLTHSFGHDTPRSDLIWSQPTVGPNVLFLDTATGSVFDHSSGIRVNGVDRTSGHPGIPAREGWRTPELDGLIIGDSFWSQDHYLEGDIAEFIVYNDITPEFMAAEEQRLLDKYDISPATESDLDESLIHGTGSWGVNARPCAYRHNNITVLGWHGETGQMGVTYHDHDTGERDSMIVDEVPNDPGDDHWTPGFVPRDDDRLLMMYARKNDLRIAMMDEPNDPTSWTVTVHEGLTNEYPMPIRWNGGIRLYTLPSGGYEGWDSHQCIYYDSQDSGKTWSDANVLVDHDPDGESVYVHPYPDYENNRIHFVQGDMRNWPSGIYHWYEEDGDFYEMDGTHIQSADSPITSKQDMTVVDESDDETPAMKNHDIVVKDSIPYLAYVRHEESPRDDDVGAGEGEYDYRAYWATWDESAGEWTTSEVTEMGDGMADTHYISGGSWLDDLDPTIVRTSVRNPDGNHVIQEYQTDDGGETWMKLRDLSPEIATVGEPTKRWRPKSVRNHQGDLPAAYCAGRYNEFNEYHANMRPVFNND